jgi:uncharacterized protein YfiM (DUF2279 family)
MFRTGGSAEGLTSGLQPRKGYYGTGNASDQRVLQDVLPGMTIGQMRDLSKELSYRPQRNNLRDFLIGFGLDIASRPPSGNIFSTAAAAAKDPFDRYTAAKQEADVAQYATESDMFKTMLGAQADILGAEKEGKGWLEQWKFKQIPLLNDKISEIQGRINSGDYKDEDELAQLKRDLRSAENQLDRIVELDPLTEQWISSEEGDRYVQGIRQELWEADQGEGGEGKYTSEEDPELGLDALDEAKRRLKKRQRSATGGRIGYQNAGAVMPAAMPTDQGAAPEDTAGVTYEELRARLPQEVTDDIVRLLANSAEALEDFAMIQTEQDINIFNKKYGVNLVLPSEG